MKAMQPYLPTYEECREIVNALGKASFYEKKDVVDGYKISMFNYHFSHPNQFFNPIKGKDYINALNMRGLTFVFNENGTLYKRFLALHKFFNVNENDENLLEDLMQIPIKEVREKIDGSCISFIELPNGRIIPKTIMGTSNEHCKMASDILSSSGAEKFVRSCLKDDIIPIFELISPNAKVVIEYEKSELILTRLRCNVTGNYINLAEMKDVLSEYKLKVAEAIDITWEELNSRVYSDENVEGWVVELANGQFVKMKTAWYFHQDAPTLQFVHREDKIIALILDNRIDDFKAKLNPDTDKHLISKVEMIENVVQKWFLKMEHRIGEQIQMFESHYNSGLTDFCLAYKHTKTFPYSILVIRGHDQYEVLKNKLKEYCYYFEKARDFVRTGEIS